MSIAKVRTGQVLDTSDEVVVVQVFEGTSGLNLPILVSDLWGAVTLAVSAADVGTRYERLRPSP